MHNQHLKKRMVAIDPQAYSVYSFENENNSGRPLELPVKSIN